VLLPPPRLEKKLSPDWVKKTNKHWKPPSHDVFIPTPATGGSLLPPSVRHLQHGRPETHGHYNVDDDVDNVDDDDEDDEEEEEEDFVKDDDDSEDEGGEAHPLDQLSTENQHLYPLMRPASATRQRRLSAQRRQHQLKHSAYAPSPGSAYISSQGGGIDENRTMNKRSSRTGGKNYRRAASATAARRKKSSEVSAHLHEIYGVSMENNGSLSSRRRENDKREALLYEGMGGGGHDVDDILERHRTGSGGSGHAARSAGPKMRKAGPPRSNSMEASPMKEGRRISFR
jgi:hypothetical protein